MKMRGIITLMLTLLQVMIAAMFPTSLIANGEAGPSVYDLRTITMADGLPHSFIDYIQRDSQGFVWMALGGGGLVRYDGYGFERFDPSLAGREISGHFVGCMREDNWDRMWVGSDQGLCVVDINTLTSIPNSQFNVDLSPADCISIKDIAFDARGRMWVSGEQGLFVITFDPSGGIADYCAYPMDGHRFNSLAARDVFGDGSVITAIDDELCCVKYEQSTGFKAEAVDCKLGARFTLNDALARGEHLWLATDQGLYRWHTVTHELRLYRHSESDVHSLSQNFVTYLAIGWKDQLLVSTLQGLNAYSDENDNFNLVDLTHNDPTATLNTNFVNCLLPEEDMLWVGTEDGGVFLLTPSRALISFYQFDDGRGRMLPVNSILEDNQRTLWVGLIEGGLAYKPKNSDKFTILTTSNSPLPHNSVSSLAMDSEDGLWVGTWGQGVVVLDRNNPTRQKFAVDLVANNGDKRPYIGALEYDALNHGVWIGTSVGLFFYDLHQRTVIEPFADAYESVKGAIGSAIDSKKHLWLGSYEGLYDIDLTSRNGDTWEYRHLENQLGNPSGNLKERVSSIRVTPDGTLWIGSSVNGLYKRQVVDGQETFVNYNIDNGLPHNSVRGILEDINGNIWVSTYNGLAKYDTEAEVWEHLQPSRHSAQFYWNAYESTSDGHLLFGASDGLVDIDARRMSATTADYQVRFTKMIVDGNAFVPNRLSSSNGTNAFEYSERQRAITIQFTALDYAKDPSCAYFYRLKGFDKNWQRLAGDRHDVTYTNLPPGNYEFEISYGRDGRGTALQSSVMSLRVAPLFYHTIWFKLICIVAILLLVYAFYRYKMARIKQQKNELEQAVRERTREISEQKVALEERNLQVQELTVDRLSFFTNITHEFRTPITLILGPLNRAQLLNDNPKVAKQLQYISRNANYLLSLVNQLMDFRKIESGKFELARRPGNFPHFMRDTLEGFEPLATDRNITLDTLIRVPEDNISFDKEAMRKLIHNFISNALKYTPDGGKITVRAALLPDWCVIAGGVRKLYVSVSDTGDGIDPADLECIFDRFYQGKGNIKYPNMASSSGIGLYLCKNIVEAYGGDLKVKNNHGPGCTFRVLLPLISEEAMEQAGEGMPLLVEPEQKEANSSPALTVLVVEDNKDMRDYIGDVLAERYNVIKVDNARTALNKLQSESIEFIVSDLMMPGMDGMEFAKIVKDNLAISHIPIIMLTAKSSDMTRRESYETGVDDFISKPFNAQVLLARIENIMQNKKRYQRQFTLDYEVDKIEIGEDSRDKKFLAQVMDVVKNNYKNSYFEVGDFAEALGVSRSFLNKKLQSLIAMSASQLVKNYRLKLAHELIEKNRETRSYTIQEIAYDVGFNDSKYFTKCFTKEFNITPSALMGK